MSTKKRFCILFIGLFTTLISCKKGSDTQAESQNTTTESQEEILLSNEIREKEGIRFILTWSVTDSSKAQDYAQLDLKLFKGAGLFKSFIALAPAPHDFINYSVLTSLLVDDGDYTISVEYYTISKDGAFDLTVIGHTATSSTKRFTLSGNVFTTTNSNSKSDFLRIKKEGSKYSFYKL